MNQAFDPIIDSFIAHDIGIDDHFLTNAMASGLREHIRQLESSGSMKKALVGNDERPDPGQQERSDQVYWLDHCHENAHESAFLRHIEAFVSHLNQTCYTGINAWEFHYAVYDPGAFYKRHTDQFRNNDHRKFSLISYLNEDWQEKDGGELCVYPERGMRKISPENGKTVFFRSDQLEHEVAATTRRRLSVTGWLKQI